RKHYIKWYMYPFYPFALLSKTGRTLLFKKNGSITDMDTSEGELKPGSSALVFDKEVCVLTSHYTFSAAADCVAAFSYAKRGKVIGDVLGQPYSGFIDIIFFELPNSGLRARASFKYYEFTGTTEANKHEGIAPDLLLDVNAYETEEALYQAVVKKVTKVTF
ncbi:MAG TPA: hypothetical protein ENJ88_08770, partial [Phaeodactylibacter sp.]|nr:hypothetical protein [Phaeodactylibacter sp.]